MIRSSVTISLVEEARGGPFVFWGDLDAGCQRARELGFDAIELFPPSASAVSPDRLRGLLDENDLKLAAVGTGAGWLIHRWSLTANEADQRHRARSFVHQMIDFGGRFGAPAIIGSMQGRSGDVVTHDQALAYLAEALDELGQIADRHGVPLLYEPLNRYETNLVNTIEAGVSLLKSLSTNNVKLLADLFHMNIEEVNVASAVRAGAGIIGHVHFVDSNRHPAGSGHTDFEPIADALREIEFQGYASAEAFPVPDSDQAARQTMNTFRALFRSTSIP